jgi:hypothetical protein
MQGALVEHVLHVSCHEFKVFVIFGFAKTPVAALVAEVFTTVPPIPRTTCESTRQGIQDVGMA